MITLTSLKSSNQTNNTVAADSFFPCFIEERT